MGEDTSEYRFRRSIFWSLIATATFLVFAVIWGSLSDFTQSKRNEFLGQGKLSLAAATDHIELALDEAKADLRFLRDQNAFQLLVSSSSTSADYDQAWVRVRDSFVNLSSKKSIYYQIRYLDETGQEIIRVDNMGNGPVAIAKEKLQNKAGRYYFEDAMKAGPDVIYLSPLDLNIEGSTIENRGTVENPEYVPVLRLATKVYSDSGQERGIIISNLYASHVLDAARPEMSPLESFSLINSDGYYLIGPTLADEWGFMFKNDRSLKVDQPDLYKLVSETDDGELLNESDQYIFLNFFPAGTETVSSTGSAAPFSGPTEVKQGHDYRWTLVAKIKSVSVGSILSSLSLYNTFDALLLAFGLVLAASFALSRRVSSSYEKILTDLSKFQQAVREASDHIVITDTNGIILYANEGVRRITGFDPKDIIGKKAGSKELWGGQMPLSFYKKLWQTIKVDRQVFGGEVINKRKNGEVYTAMASISPVIDRNGKLVYFIGIERDITQEKLVDKAKTEFVSLASHQLRTPLSAINWYSEMLMKGDAGKLSTKQRDFVQEICQGSHRMVALVSSLLNVSRLELGTFAVELSDVKLNDEIRAELKELAPQIKDKKLKISTKLAARLPVLRADTSLIRMVVQNLLSNAVKYTPDGGHITVTTIAKKTGLHLEVTDTGYGIPSNQQGKIFEKLFRADNVVSKEVEGTGLGLYIVKSIVNMGKGKIWLKSVEDKGTTFYVDLPFKGMTSKKGTKKLES